jgi:hypothetical protein
MKSSSYRPNTERFTFSARQGLGEIVKDIKTHLDLNGSQIFRLGMDEVMRKYKGKLPNDVIEKYWMWRGRTQDAER